MHERTWRQGRRVLAVVVATAALVARAPAGEGRPEDMAKAVLEASGVQGGLVVHVGCGDGRLALALGASDRYLVNGVDTDPAAVEAARKRALQSGRYGKVSFDRFDGRRLPYVDNLVNLIVADGLGDVSREEALRALAPGGVLCLRSGDVWKVAVKPRPSEIDEWTHYLHGPTNNAVAEDSVVGPPAHFQWVGSPRYSRHHDHMSNASAMVSAGGRLFYIFDHASPLSIQLPSDYRVVARDAFNGTVLWQRSIDKWYTRLFRLKSGPAQLPRRLVASRERVYATLGIDAPVTALDAATGRTVRTYESTAGTEEILLADGMLYLLVNDSPPHQPPDPGQYDYNFVQAPRRILAVDSRSGTTRWTRPANDIFPLTLTVGEGKVLFCDGSKVVCVDQKDGEWIWSSRKLAGRTVIPTFFAPTLVLYDGVVLFSGGSTESDERNRGGGTNTMYALSAESGETLWTAEHPPSGYKSPEDILVVQGLVWTPATTVGADSGVMIGRDLRTGEVRKKFLPDVETHWFHHRCYRAKATSSYILTSRTGIEFVDPKEEHWTCHHWVRGACLYGVMPANGMVYNPPHPCACYLEAKLYGFHALAPASASRAVPREISPEGRLEPGPFYEEAPAVTDGSEDWPTYRADAARSGRTESTVPAALEPAWETPLGGRLSPVVVAGGAVLVCAIDQHTVYALDAQSGKRRWSFTAGGRVDSPPTVWRGRVLFGSADGYVYCVRAADGGLVWRFRAAPVDLRMGAFEQLESVWPVHGSVLVLDGELWCVAGRSMFLDGGLRLIRLDPATGKLIKESVLDDRDPDSDGNLQVRLKGLNMPVALPDVLSWDGKYVYMRSQRFDRQGTRHEIEVPTLNVSEQRGEGSHLFSPTGFLDDIWWHRSYWVFGRVFKSGAGGYYQAGRVLPAGRPMVFDETKVYGYGRLPKYYRWTTPLEYQLFATAKEPARANAGEARRAAGKARRTQPAEGGAQRRRAGAVRRQAGGIAYEWTGEIPVLVRAMVLAGETLFVAGPPQVVDEVATLAAFGDAATQKQLLRQARVFEGSEGALLWAVSASSGKRLSELRLPSVPVFDGMAAAGGKLYLATTDGKVVCLSKR